MKKLYQYLLIGGIGIIILYLVHKKGAILASAGGGGGTSGGSVMEGSSLQDKAKRCINRQVNMGSDMQTATEMCGNMVFPL